MTAQEVHPNRKIRVAVVEDDPILRENLSGIIQTSPSLKLEWVAESLKSALAADLNKVDVALVDLGLPDGRGETLIESFSKTSAKILVVTIFDDRQSVEKSINSGAHGYITKDSRPVEIVTAIETLADGGAPLSSIAAMHLLNLVQDRQRRPKKSGAAADTQQNLNLTEREVELLTLFAKGLSYKEAAAALNISRHTVGDYVKSIYRKLAVNSRNEAIYEAIYHKLIDIEPR